MKELLLKIFNDLLRCHGPRHWWPADTPFEVAVGAFLTQNTAWGNVERALVLLKEAGPLTPRGLLCMEPRQLEQRIRPTGFFRQKAQRLRLFSAHLVTHYGGELERMLNGRPLNAVRNELLDCRGVGPETADSILLYAGGRPSFVVDAYTRRLFGRLGLVCGDAPYGELRRWFMARLPLDSALFNEYHALIVAQSQQACRPRPLCQDCCLQENCAEFLKRNQGAHALRSTFATKRS